MVLKSMLFSLLEKEIYVVQQLTASTNLKVVNVSGNGMAILPITKSCGADTFGGL